MIDFSPGNAAFGLETAEIGSNVNDKMSRRLLLYCCRLLLEGDAAVSVCSVQQFFEGSVSSKSLHVKVKSRTLQASNFGNEPTYDGFWPPRADSALPSLQETTRTVEALGGSELHVAVLVIDVHR